MPNGGEAFGVQVPQIVVGRRGPQRAHTSWVSEDRRSRAARSRGPREIAVVGCGFPGVGWGAWTPKIRRQASSALRGPVMAERCAVIGVGQTKHASRRIDVSIAGLVREAALAALADAGIGWADVDAVVIGKAPDMFEGVMMPELYLADALGAVGKPMMRVHTAGSVGGSTGVMASHLVASGAHKRVLVVCFEKQSESNATWALSIRLPFTGGSVTGAGGYFAPVIRAYMRRSNAP